MAMIEKEIGHNVQTNGETTFYHVFRKFMDGANGYAMGSMTAGNTYTHYANSYHLCKQCACARFF